MINPIQREILEALIRLYEKKKETIKGEDIAGMLHRTPGTIRNHMQTLKALGYVEGVPGPKGGYMPAMKAYEALEMEVVKKPYLVQVCREGRPIEGLKVQKMVFTQIQNPTTCMSMITVLGDTRKIMEHDLITVGPTPVNHVTLKGEVVGRDDTRKEILIATHSITSIPKGKVMDLATKNLVSVNSRTCIRDCAGVLMEKGIRAAPVIDGGTLTGIVTEAEIVKAMSKGDVEGLVGDIAVKDPHTIDGGARIIDCIQKMKEHGVGRLVVTCKNRPCGIITRTDILLRMLE
ncbi:MAG: CBS domain-containing protein [Candidatus Altiarchaeota archaeon]|nr:CBS domain-containing protein [Candidatus Altiarchaeota archaeon]